MNPDEFRFGHAMTREGLTFAASSTDEDVLLASLDVLHGTVPLAVRPPREDSVVYGAEAALGIPRSERPLYAFVGDLNPNLGEVGLIVERSWADERLQGTTRCDSGGLYGGFGAFEHVGDQQSRIAAVLALSLPSGRSPLTDWAREFREELSRHFNPISDYLDGNASRSRYGDARYRCQGTSSSTDRRWWTWEARFRAAPVVSEYTHFVVSHEMKKALERVRRAHRREPPDTVRVLSGGVGDAGVVFAEPAVRRALGGA